MLSCNKSSASLMLVKNCYKTHDDFSQNVPSQIVNNTISQVLFDSAILSFARVHLEVTNKAARCFDDFPHFNSLLNWLHRHVLFHSKLSFEFYKCLINRWIFTGSVLQHSTTWSRIGQDSHCYWHANIVIVYWNDFSTWLFGRLLLQ